MKLLCSRCGVQLSPRWTIGYIEVYAGRCPIARAMSRTTFVFGGCGRRHFAINIKRKTRASTGALCVQRNPNVAGDLDVHVAGCPHQRQ